MFKFLTLFYVISLATFCNSIEPDFEINNTKCNSYIEPMAVDANSLYFSWEITTADNDFSQHGYQIIVSDNLNAINENKGNVWDTGKIVGDQSLIINYKGETLESAAKYYWKVKVWSDKETFKWSAVSSFGTALSSKKDWSDAKWIGYEKLADNMRVIPGVHNPDAHKLGDKAKKRALIPLFRKKFIANNNIKNATISISGLGHYELTINNKKVGNSFLAPGWTLYDKTVLFNTYDVTKLIQQGENIIGAIVGNGFHYINRERYYKLVTAYGYPKIICKLHIEYDDGTTTNIISNNSWKTTASPITYTSIFGGEDYDARLEIDNWTNASFDDSNWKDAILTSVPSGSLKPEISYPVILKDTFNVKNIIKTKKGNYVYDFGQNASGIIELKVKGKKGQTIKLWPAELITKENQVNQNASGGPYYFSYTLKGNGIETWKPLFTYYGFRYVEVEGAIPDSTEETSDSPRILELKELHNTSSAPETGTFECSNELFNKINSLIKWAMKSNVQSVLTDCPHREKLSWLEVDYLMGNSIHYNLDVYHLYKKLIYDMIDSQTAEGLVPDISPEYVPFEGGFRDSPEWGSASVILPWMIYKWSGDKDIIEDAYDMMNKYVGYLESKSNDGILSHGLGDWFDYGPNRPGEAQLTPKSLTATAIYYYDLSLLAKMAALLEKEDDANLFFNKSEYVKTAFNNKFFNTAENIYSTGSQTAMAMPLCVGLVDEKNEKAVFANMVKTIKASGKKLTAGDVGYHFLVEALHKGGESQLLFDMNNRDDVPGYGFQLKKGATALTESWPAHEEVSNNHIMLGHIMEWFYYGILGISQSETSVGYKDIIIKPEVVGDLTFAKGSFKSPYGLITNHWKKEGATFEMEVKIPANTTASVYLPTTKNSKILVDDVDLKKAENVELINIAQGVTIVKITSGQFKFKVTTQ